MSIRENLGALSERDFRLFYTGNVASLIGDAMMLVATPFIVFDLGGDTTEVGFVFATQTAALVATLLIGGVIADRVSRRRLMIGADAARAVVQFVYAILLLSGQAELWHVFVAQILGGVNMGLFEPAFTGLLPQTVSKHRLHGANALRSIAWSSADTIGPAIAGAVIALSGLGEVVLLDAATFALSAAALTAMRVRPPPASDSEAGFLEQMREGWDEFRSRRWLWVIVGAFALNNAFVFGPYIVLGASISEQSLGGADAWATILAIGGIGAIIGGLISLQIRPKHPLVVAMAGCLPYIPALILLGAEAPVVVIALMLAIGEGSLSIFGTLWDTTLQRVIPPDKLSRVSSYDWFGSAVFHPVGYALAGPMALLLGASGALLAGAALLATTTVLALLFGGLREIDRDTIAEHAPGGEAADLEPEPG